MKSKRHLNDPITTVTPMQCWLRMQKVRFVVNAVRDIVKEKDTTSSSETRATDVFNTILHADTKKEWKDFGTNLYAP